MAINDVAGWNVYHVWDILREFIGHVYGLRTLKPKKTFEKTRETYKNLRPKNFFLKLRFSKPCFRAVRGHRQAWAMEALASTWKCCKVFLCTVVTNKCCRKSQWTMTKYLCIVFKTCRQLGLAPKRTPTGAAPLNLVGDFRPSDRLICPSWEKKSGVRPWSCFRISTLHRPVWERYRLATQQTLWGRVHISETRGVVSILER